MDVNENGIEMDSELGKELQEVSVEKESRYKDFDARYKCSFNLYIFYFNFDLSVKHVFVLTMAGKPVWARYGVEEQTSALMGWVKNKPK